MKFTGTSGASLALLHLLLIHCSANMEELTTDQTPVSWEIVNPKSGSDSTIGKDILKWALQTIQKHERNDTLSEMNYTVTLNISVNLNRHLDYEENGTQYQRTGESLSITLIDNNNVRKYEWQETQLLTVGTAENVTSAAADLLAVSSPIKLQKNPKTYFPKSCEDVFKKNKTSGIYVISQPIPGSKQYLNKNVYCDFTTDGGGWTVIQRRTFPTGTYVDFNQTWSAYVNGFGDLTGSFWIGLDTIANLTRLGDQLLMITAMDWNDVTKIGLWRTFLVGDSTTNYRLYVAGFIPQDSFRFQDGMDFSTVDRDNDKSSEKNCAKNWSSGWWFSQCYNVNLNGVYSSVPHATGIEWRSWHGFGYSLKYVEMKIRSKGFTP